MHSAFSQKPCGPANEELERAVGRMVVKAKCELNMKQGLEDIQSGTGSDKFKCGLNTSLIYDKFCGEPKKYSPAEWASLIFRAYDEGPPTRTLDHNFHELQRLEVLLGKMTFDEAVEMEQIGSTKAEFDKFMGTMHPGTQEAAQRWGSACGWQAGNGEYLYPPHHKATDMFKGIPDVEKEEAKELDTSDQDQFPGLPLSPTKEVGRVPTPISSPIPSPKKKKEEGGWGPRVAVKYAKGKKSRRGKKKK